MARVVAVERGHDGRAVREIGEEFDVDTNEARFKGCTWFVPVNKRPPPVEVDPRAQPPGAGPKKGSAVADEAPPPGAGPLADSSVA